MSLRLGVLFEHPEWQRPLFDALARRGVDFVPIDLKHAAFDPAVVPGAAVYFNQASPSAYLRGNTRAVPFALALMRALEQRGARVLNGAAVFSLELSKSAQAALLHALGICTPRTVTFNDAAALRDASLGLRFPALLKPEQGGSGARIHRIDDLDQLEALLVAQPELWAPDNLLNLQELVPHDVDGGIVRMEFVGGELLYAMRVFAHGQFNLCPSPVCNPEDASGEAGCSVPTGGAAPVEFVPFPDIPPAAVAEGRRIVEAARIDVGGIEYLEDSAGRRVFYDINANSNLRPSIGAAFGLDPFARVAEFLEAQLHAPDAAPRGSSRTATVGSARV